MNYYSYDDYRDLISSVLANKHGRGSKVRLANELNCQPGYISQVLTKSKIHFSPENIIKISEFLELNLTESEFLLNLLYKERAGSKSLRDFYERKILQVQNEQLQIDKQIKISSDLDEAVKATYYSHWAYCAIHMLVSIEAYQRVDLIAQKLNLKLEFTQKILDFLVDKSLISKKGKQYSIGTTRIHLTMNSPLVKSHHQNYRHKAMIALEEENDYNFNYSSVMTLSKADALKIRELVIKLILSKDKILIPSENEDIICLNLDLFKL